MMEVLEEWMRVCGVTPATAATAVVLCCLTLLWWRRSTHGLPPGPCGLPVVGYLPWLDPRAPHLTLTQLVGRYGKVFSLRLGGVLVVVLADPQLVKDALSRKGTAGRAPLYLTHGIMKGQGLICSEGEVWREHRKFVLGLMREQGMRTAATRGVMEPKILAVAATLTKELGESPGSVDVSSRLLHHVGNTMNQLIFGLTYPESDPTWRWLRHLLEEGTKLIGVAGPLNFLPWLRWIPKFRRTISFITENQEKTHQEYQAIIDHHQAASLPPTTPHHPQGKVEQGQEGQEEGQKRLDEREEEREEKQEEQGIMEQQTLTSTHIPQHIVGAYLKERDARGKGEGEGSFTLRQLYHVAADLFGAGSETTITTLKWHLLNMALFPEVQRRVQAELDEHAHKDVPFTLAEADLLPFTQASILESQRLRSILPLGIPHGTTQELTIAGYRVPKGTMLLPLLWHIHHDPASWPNPHTYRPERFLGEGGGLVKHPAFMPFQTGRRVCIGDEFARMILFVFTTTLLREMEVGLGEEVEGDPAADPVCGISLTPRPFTLTFTPRH